MRLPLIVRIACVADRGNVYGVASPSGLALHLKGSIISQCPVTHKKRRHVPPVVLAAAKLAMN